jgi:hypothetical protein
MAKVKRSSANEKKLIVQCPGCGYRHRVRVAGNGPTWHWNEDKSAPTITPSIHVMPGSEAECHFQIEDGKIEYLPDCHHDLAGQSVELPDIK